MSARKYLVLFVVLALSAILIAACTPSTSTGGSSGSTTITVSDDLKFTPNVINAKPGQAVEVVVDNSAGKTDHTFIVKDLKVNEQIPAGKKTTVKFTAPAAGTYTFECDLPGHKEAGMIGQIVVK